MRDLSWSDFSEAVGTTYSVESGDAHLTLTLEQATEIESSGRSAMAFRLQFRGPEEPILPQAIYRFATEDAMLDIFIVPIGRDADGTTYEAIFN